MMKGIECLNMLSYKVQVQFLKNYASLGKDISEMLLSEYDNKDISEMLLSEYDNVYQFVGGNFFWDDTPEGADYWNDIANIFTQNKIKI